MPSGLNQFARSLHRRVPDGPSSFSFWYVVHAAQILALRDGEKRFWR